MERTSVPRSWNTPPSECQFDDLRFVKLRFVNAAILDAALERMLRRAQDQEPFITAEPAVQKARERADYAAILGNIIIQQRNLLLDEWATVEEDREFAIRHGDASILRENITEMLDRGELKATKNDQHEISFCYTQVYKLCLSLESKIKIRTTQTETIGGMFEDHVVPKKLTPEFATKTKRLSHTQTTCLSRLIVYSIQYLATN